MSRVLPSSSLAEGLTDIMEGEHDDDDDEDDDDEDDDDDDGDDNHDDRNDDTYLQQQQQWQVPKRMSTSPGLRLGR